MNQGSVPYFSPYYFCCSVPPIPNEAVKAEEELSKKKYKRTWTRDQVAELVRRTEEYAALKERPLQALDSIDFQMISAGMSQTASQCYVKVCEVYANGTLQPGVWTAEEDALLKGIAVEGVKKWRNVAKQLNVLRHQGRKIRTGKQCKERWNNHLNPAIKHGNWSAADDLELLKAYKSQGNHWSNISKTLGNRTESSVKNRIKSLINKELQCIDLKQDRESAIENLLAKRRYEAEQELTDDQLRKLLKVI